MPLCERNLKNTIFDAAYYEAANGFCWVFWTPDTQGEFELLFYAGMYGSTAENSVIYQDVTVEKLHGNDTWRSGTISIFKGIEKAEAGLGFGRPLLFVCSGTNFGSKFWAEFACILRTAVVYWQT